MTVLPFFFAALANAILAIATTVPFDNTTSLDSKSVNILQHHVGTSSREGFRQRRMTALEETVGVPQSTVDDQRALIAKLRASNAELTAANGELKESNIKLKASVAELTHQIIDWQLSDDQLRQLVADCHKLLTYERDLSKGTVTTSPASSLTSTVATTQAPRPTPAGSSAEQHREFLSKELLEAADRGNAKRIRQLVAEGANLEYRDGIGLTALHGAARNGHVDALRELIQLGASLDTEAVNGYRPLHFAARNQRVDCLKELLSAGANVNVRDVFQQTPLHFAAAKESRPIIVILIAAGADKRAKDIDGKVPKDYAKSDSLRALL